jgi:regulator of protease activity HflC (stomatin/prohibitin superfamily)
VLLRTPELGVLAASSPPHIDHAGRYLPTLVTLALVFADAGLLAIAGAIIGDTMPDLRTVLPLRPIGLVGSSLLIAAGGFIAAALLAYTRQRIGAEPEAAAPAPESDVARALASRLRLLAPAKDDGAWIARWPMAAATAVIGLLAAAGVLWSSRLSPSAGPDASADLFAAGALALVAFPVLVLERIYANADATSLPEAPKLQWLLRVPLAALLGLALSAALLGSGFAWAAWIEQIVGVVILLVAAELVLRAAATLFLPFPPPEEARSIAESTLARAIRLAPPSLQALSVAVERQFGIDLSRSWAIRFLARAAAPVGLALIVLAWALTGVTALRLDERAIYQRFGVPVAVLGPGLHVGLPWPLGVMRRVELGVLHDVPVALTSSALVLGGVEAVSEAAPPLPSAEELEPTGADRLWDQSHPWEASYLVASQSHGQQSFQAVAIDIRLIYRVGLSDAAALAAAYRVDDPERLVRAAAGQLLARYFASHTLLGVLVADRESFATEFRATLQRELDRLSSGLDVVAVLVEAIHPPPGAANAYHNVQAAEINAKVSIADEQGAAAKRAAEAAQESTLARNEATALAAETIGKAQAEGTLFGADDRSYAAGGKAFLLERWLDRARAALSRAQLVVLDHRLGGAEAATIDLRDFAPAAATP